MDVVGVGTGAFAGAKVGAAIGAWFTPAGAAAGALVGGVAGGIGGKMASNSFRYAPFRTAVEDFEVWSVQAESAVNTAVLGTRGEVEVLQGSFQQLFAMKRDALHKQTSQKVTSVQAAFEKSFLEFAEAFVTFLIGLEDALEREMRRVLGSLQSSSWRARFWPTAHDTLRSAIEEWFLQSQRTVARERGLIAGAPHTLDGKRSAIVRFTQMYRFDGTALNGDLAVLMQEYLYAQDEARYIQRTAEAELHTKRDSLVQQFGAQVSVVHDALMRTVREWNERMRSKKEALQREAAAVGIDL